MDKINNIAVLGGGAWGTALAAALARRHPQDKITLWAREAEVVAAVNNEQENKIFLPEIKLPQNILATNELEAAAAAQIILMVVPSQFARGVIQEAASYAGEGASFVLCSKGLEQQSLKFMSEVAEDYLSQKQIAVLSGPSFADELARGLPAAVTLACADTARAEMLAEAIGSAYFRLYLSNDVIGAEIGGVIKNVLAVACGIVSGQALGENARAAIITRGFNEMQRLGAALGAGAQSLQGLCGLGDLILTCTSTRSRNFSLGEAVGRGQSVQEFLGARQSVSEGAASAAAVAALAKKHGVEMPICAATAAIINDGVEVATAIEELLEREVSIEIN